MARTIKTEDRLVTDKENYNNLVILAREPKAKGMFLPLLAVQLEVQLTVDMTKGSINWKQGYDGSFILDRGILLLYFSSLFQREVQ